MKLGIKLLILSAISISANAAAEWTELGKLTTVYPKPSRNGIYFKHEKMVTGGCSASTHLFLNAEQALFKETYSLLLSAYVAGKQVKIFVSGCQVGHNYPLISEVVAQ